MVLLSYVKTKFDAVYHPMTRDCVLFENQYADIGVSSLEVSARFDNKIQGMDALRYKWVKEKHYLMVIGIILWV